ncbi:MAG TPA: hypothetical protein VNQ90_11350 [Chthoniobacteraceae bacterium]|nr:hypothetical protein [Chthoniobacteraceae bacterium]
MFGFIKNFFGKSDEASEAPLTKTPTPPPSPAGAPPASPPAATRPPAEADEPLPPPVRTRGRMERVLIPLKAITDTFPRDLAPLIATPPGASVMVAFQVEKLLSQLAQGKVEVTIGELRKIAPVSTFTHDASCDGEKVSIPLRELAARLDPSILQRSEQRQVELPGSIDNVFVKRGETPPPAEPEPMPPAEPAESAAPPAPPASAPLSMPPPVPEPVAPVPEPEPPAPHAPSIAPTGGLKFAPPEEAALRAEPAPVPPEVKSERGLAFNPSPEPAVPAPAATPEAPLEPKGTTLPGPTLDAPEEKPTPALKLQSAPAPAPAPAPISPPAPAPRLPVADAPPSSRPSAPAAGTASTLSLPLEKISTGWPETIRASLAGLPPDATLELPLATVGEALKLGKIALPWPMLRAAIRPALPPSRETGEGPLLTLPLPVVAPLFMAAAAPSPEGRRVTIDESIPGPFASARPAAETGGGASAPAISSTSTAAGSPRVPVSARRTSGGGTLGFEGRLPSELVERACSLGGVAGAVIALQEGLLVAAKMPPEFTEETLGAFLPQLFGRVEETTENMKIGPLQNLMFTAGDRPWQIWKVGNAFFAAMGKPNELLPGSQLKIIAAQLARHTRG